MTQFILRDEIKIGTVFRKGNYSPIISTVYDILKTYNNSGELVETRYACYHVFMGQEVKSTECATTIQRGFIRHKKVGA